MTRILFGIVTCFTYTLLLLNKYNYNYSIQYISHLLVYLYGICYQL